MSILAGACVLFVAILLTIIAQILIAKTFVELIKIGTSIVEGKNNEEGN